MMWPDTTNCLLAVTVAFLSLLWWLSTRRPPGIPPGPGPALPLLGHLHLLMGKDPRPKFQEWRRQYGDVFSLYMGGRLVVVLNGFQVIKEALVKHADDFSDRPHMFSTDSLARNLGLVLTSGQQWKEQRKTALEILREFGLGKNVLAERVQEEVTHYIRAVEDLQGAPENLYNLTSCSVSNNISSIMFGQRFEYDDPAFTACKDRMQTINRNIVGSAIINFFPILEKMPGDLFKAKESVKAIRYIDDDFILPQLVHHKETYSKDQAQDFIHAYLRQAKVMRDTGRETTLDDLNLVRSTSDLFAAGTETTATSIVWTLLYLLHYPEVQDKCFQEIAQVVGTARPPSIGDKADLPYLEATIMEVQRTATLAPFAVQHGNPRDVTFRGYVIPHGAIVLPNLYSVLHDPEIWGDAENFRPERFIGPDGQVVNPEEFIPFGLGRRVCLGEKLARMELFLYLASLLQRFRFLPEDPEHLPSVEGDLGIVHIPKPYKIRAVPRK